MKLSVSSSVSRFAYQRLSRHFFGSASSLKLKAPDSLYRKISPLGDPRVSVVPVLDQWVREGQTVDKYQLRRIIKEFSKYKRYKHALEISEWMSNKMYVPVSTGDVVSRLNLISRVRGIEKAENYFNNIPQKLKDFRVYTALLNCYANENHVEKAESDTAALQYVDESLLSMGNWQKMDILMHEMEEKGIRCDSFTFAIRLTAYAAVSDCKGIDDMVMRMESDPDIVVDGASYAVAADGYLKAGQNDKAFEMLKRLEGLVTKTKRRTFTFHFLLKLYADADKKDEVYRIWDLYKENCRICNKGYMSMMGSLLKFNDIEGIEKLFREWEMKGLSYDFRIPNFLIDAYCRNRLLEKAEALIYKGINKGGKPLDTTWYLLAGGYLEDNQFPKAVEALKNAIAAHLPGSYLRPDILSAC
ncbi:hypothetical protein NMG60_11012708 [Bertholletia excelsa]